jgi:hypothetical protein
LYRAGICFFSFVYAKVPSSVFQLYNGPAAALAPIPRASAAAPTRAAHFLLLLQFMKSVSCSVLMWHGETKKLNLPAPEREAGGQLILIDSWHSSRYLNGRRDAG